MTNKPSDRLEEIKWKFVERFSDSGSWKQDTYPIDAWEFIDSSIRQAVESALKSVELKKITWKEAEEMEDNGGGDWEDEDFYNQAVEDQRKKHKEVLEGK